jgi:hypothetical protein
MIAGTRPLPAKPLNEVGTLRCGVPARKPGGTFARAQPGYKPARPIHDAQPNLRSSRRLPRRSFRAKAGKEALTFFQSPCRRSRKLKVLKGPSIVSRGKRILAIGAATANLIFGSLNRFYTQSLNCFPILIIRNLEKIPDAMPLRTVSRHFARSPRSRKNIRHKQLNNNYIYNGPIRTTAMNPQKNSRLVRGQFPSKMSCLTVNIKLYKLFNFSPQRTAGFQTCCTADFQIGKSSERQPSQIDHPR